MVVLGVLVLLLMPVVVMEPEVEPLKLVVVMAAWVVLVVLVVLVSPLLVRLPVEALMPGLRDKEP